MNKEKVVIPPGFTNNVTQDQLNKILDSDAIPEVNDYLKDNHSSFELRLD